MCKVGCALMILHKNMDIHIVVDIVLHHHTSVKQWSTTRLLCKSTLDIVDNLQYKRGVYGRATFITPNKCESCLQRFHESDIKFIWYKSDDITRRRLISYCPHWFCKISAVCSMLEDVRVSNIHVVRKPYLPEEPVLIPRSSGKQTEATLNQHYTFVRDGKHYVRAEWGASPNTYYKYVALDQIDIAFTPPTMDALLTDRCDRVN